MLQELPQVLANAVVLAGSYALLAVGFATIFGSTRIFHFAHGSVYVSAAYLLYFFTTTLHWSLLPAALAAIVAGSVLGGLINLVVYEPLLARDSSRHVVFISSLGVFIAFDSIVSLPFGRSPLAVPSTLPAEPAQIAGAFVTPAQLLEVGASVLLLLLVPAFLKFTRVGVAVRALAGDPTLANTLGVNITLTRTVVFLLGSALAAAASVLVSLDVGSIDPNMGLNAILVATVAVILGGIGSLPGAALAGIVLASFIVFSQGYLSARWTDVVVYLAVIGVVMFWPQGLMGRKLSRLGK